MANDQIAQDQEPEFLPIQNRISQFFKKKFMVIGMFILGISLSLLAIFAISQLSGQGQIPKTSKDIAKKTFAPTAPFVADQLIVKLKDSYTRDEIEKLNKKLTELGVVSQEKAFESEDPLLRNYFILRFKEGTDIEKVGQELINLSDLEVVEPNYLVEIQAIPNDLLYGEMWGLEKILMPQAWDIVNGSSSVVVAVIDTGVDYNHQDFVGRSIIKGQDFSTCDAFVEDSITGKSHCTSPKLRGSDPMDHQGHGTHVAGIIGATTNNNLGISGIMWNVTLMAVKTIGADPRGRGNSQDIIDGIIFAVDNGADVINLSLGTETPCGPGALYKDVIDYAIGKGAIVVGAAGNGGADHIGDDVSNYSPASCDNVIAVSSVTQSDMRPVSSNWGQRVDIAAPGADILSTILGNAYGPKSGTSMAAPHVSGVIGLLLAANPGLSQDQVKSCLINSADPITTDENIGPRLNAYNTLTLCTNIASIPTGTNVTPSPIISPTEQPTSEPLTPSPTAVKTYTCKEDSRGSTARPGSIKIGSLICEPN